MVVIVKRGEGAHEITCRSCGSVLRYHDGEVQERSGSDYSGCGYTKRLIPCPVCENDVIISSS